MLTAIYIEALLIDEELADHVWEAWDNVKLDDKTACIAWLLITGVCSADGQHEDTFTGSR